MTTTEPTVSDAPPPLHGVAAVLRSPARVPTVRWSTTAALACLAGYGALAGFFEGGGAVALAALKLPLVGVVALVLCLPSFVVFLMVAGEERRPRELAAAAAGFAAVVGLFLLALGPVAWLFSVSSRSLGFVVVLHVMVLVTALGFGLRFVRQVLGTRGGRRAAVLWTAMLFVVVLQVAAYLGPVLGADGSVLELRRESFLARFGRVVDEAR
jgi:hypothetical protein